MAQIKKRTIIIKDKAGNAIGSAGFTEISENITVKVSLNIPKSADSLMLAFEGDGLPLNLHDITALNGKIFKAENKAALNENVTAVVFRRSSNASAICGWGFSGNNAINAESMVSRAGRRLVGKKIVPPQEEKEQLENKASYSVKIPSQNEKALPRPDKYEAEEKTWEKKIAELPKAAPESIKSSKPQNRNTFISEEFLWTEREKNRYKEETVSYETPEAVEKKNKEKAGLKQDWTADSLAEGYSEFRSDDPYMREDTTLSDIEIIAEDNYFERENINGFTDFNAALSAENGDNPVEAEYENMEYYEKVKTKLLKLLSENEKDDFLCRLIPQSDFVRISYGEDKFYCVGLVKEEGKPAYICYGVPGEYSPVPPEEFEGCGRWIPGDSNNPEGRGYWMMFQSVEDGKSIKTPI